MRRFYGRSRYLYSANFRTGGESSSLRGDYRDQISGYSSSLSLFRCSRWSVRSAACSMAGGVMDDRSRTVFHTINNRYRRPVVNPELSSWEAGRRGTRGHALLSRDQEAIGGPLRAPLHAFEYLEYGISERANSSIPIVRLSRFWARKGSGWETPRRWIGAIPVVGSSRGIAIARGYFPLNIPKKITDSRCVIRQINDFVPDDRLPVADGNIHREMQHSRRLTPFCLDHIWFLSSEITTDSCREGVPINLVKTLVE